MANVKLSDSEALKEMTKLVTTGGCDCDCVDCINGSFVALLNVAKEMRIHRFNAKVEDVFAVPSAKGAGSPADVPINDAVYAAAQELGAALKVQSPSGGIFNGALIQLLLAELTKWVYEHKDELFDLFWDWLNPPTPGPFTKKE